MNLEVSGNDGNTSFALFSVSAETVSTESDVLPVAGFNQTRRDGEWRGAGDATMQAIAAAAAITAVTPHFAQAETHQTIDAQSVLPSEGGNGHGWQGASLADLAAAGGAAGSQSAGYTPSGTVDSDQSAAIGYHGPSLSDIISQRFENLSSAGNSDEPETGGWKPAGQDHGGGDAAVSSVSGASHDAPPSQAASDNHDAPASSHDGGWKGGTVATDTPGLSLGQIVDFSNLPSFDAPLHDAGPKALSIPDLKHGDFAGIVDFSVDLLPEPHAPSASPSDHGNFGGEGFTMHAPVHEPVHVAVNDVIQSMAHEAEAASHHPH